MGKKIETVDCTIQKPAAELFNENIEYYKLLFENIGIPIFVFNIEGIVISCNKAANYILGGKTSGYIGESVLELFGGTAGSEFLKRIQLSAANDINMEYEDFVQLPTGNFWFLSNITRIIDKDASVIGVQVICNNITKRKEIEESIKKNEEKFHALFSALTDMIIEIDNEGRLVEVLTLNPSLHSKTYMELVGKTLHEIFPKAQADFILRNVRQTLEKREAVDINHSLKINENELLFEGKLSPLKSNSVLLVEREVTEHIKAEEAVRFANSYNRSLIEASLDPFVTIGPDGKITDVNKATELVTGFSHKQLIGDDFSNYFTYPTKARAGYKKVLAEGFVRDYPLTIKHVSGTTTDVLYNATVYKNEKGEIQGVFAAAHDITISKRAEVALRESEEKYRKLVEQSPDAVLIHVDGIIHFVNTSSVRLFEAASKEELIGKKIIDLVHPDFKQVVRQKVKKIIEKEVNVPTIEEKLISLKGKIFYADVTATPINLSGKNSVQVVARDITERKEAQEEIHNSKKQLEQLYKHLNDVRENERAEISREIHDELGQSLTALRMDLSSIKEKVIDKILVDKKINDMIGIVNYTLKKVQKISATLRPGMLDDLGLVPSVEWYCHEFHERTDISCNCMLKEIPMLNQNLTLTLFRILQEGLTNIIRHAKAKNVDVELFASDGTIILKIIDDGVGASQEKLNSKNSLGLMGMRERLKQFNGALEIISSLNKGTTLVVSVPIN